MSLIHRLAELRESEERGILFTAVEGDEAGTKVLVLESGERIGDGLDEAVAQFDELIHTGRNKLVELDDGPLEDDASYGLMQVMGYNARRLVGALPGTKLDFGFLLLPITNLAFGLRVLLGELAATGNVVARALARYNGGPTGDSLDGNGVMRRQVYVDGVAKWAERVARETGQ